MVIRALQMQTSLMTFPQSGYHALIFDLDGTVVNSMPAHFEAWCRALAENGAPSVFPEEVFYAMGGLPTRDIVAVLNSEQGLDLDPDAISLAKRHHFLDCLDQVTLVDEVIDFARANAGKVPMAIASGGSRLVVERTLKALEIADLFDEVLTADDVRHGKPAPDIFLEAAERLDVAPESCVVFEDAPAGIEAARSAGMEVVLVPTQLHST